nr:hypothetical protein [Tanacetum cinerariifolium]
DEVGVVIAARWGAGYGVEGGGDVVTSVMDLWCGGCGGGRRR